MWLISATECTWLRTLMTMPFSTGTLGPRSFERFSLLRRAPENGEARPTIGGASQTGAAAMPTTGQDFVIYPFEVRSIALVTAAVLAVIGVGVGVETATAHPAEGTISGVIRIDGGASDLPRLFDLWGTVTATSSSGATYTTTTGADGIFVMELPPGTYMVAASSPSVQDGSAVAGPLRVSLAPVEKFWVKFAFQIP
jgi:hypothetical protein